MNFAEVLPKMEPLRSPIDDVSVREKDISL